MSTGLSGDSTLMNTDETLWVVRVNSDVPQGTAYVDGKIVRNPADITMFACVCNVQPVTGRDIVNLPEGQQYDDQFWTFSNEHQQPVQDGDVVTREGTRYECRQTEQWGNYTRARWVADQTLPSFDPDTDTPAWLP